MSRGLGNLLGLLLPKGAFWKAVEEGDLWNVGKAIGENAEPVFEFLKGLAFLRDPSKTLILSDLEKEYGVLTDLRLDEDTRRQILASYAFAKPTTASENNLEAILRDAGFDVRVYQNNAPTIDPDVLTTAYQMIAGTTTAVAGNEDAFAGVSGGYLIVNGSIYETILTDPMQADGAFAFAGNQRAVAGYYLAFDRERIDYDIPTDPDVWRFVFFIGGEATGWTALLDWNMEQAGVENWKRADETKVEKTFDAPVPLPALDSRTLRVTSLKKTEQQNFETDQPDPSLEMSALMFKNAGNNVINIGWQRFVSDGDMERPNTSAWTISNNAVLTKQTSSPYRGKYYLRVAYGGTMNPGAFQVSPLRTANRTYRIIGAARGDGVAGVPEIRNSGVQVWIGTSSNTWQPFDVTWTNTGGTSLTLRDSAIASTGYVEFDDVAIYELVDLVDGDMETAGVGAWTNSGNATLTKEGGAYRGKQCLRVECASGSNPYAYQTILQSSQRYRMKGFIRSDGNAIPNIDWDGTTIWIGTTSTDWQQFEIVFRNTGATQLRLEAVTSTVGEYCEFDEITIEPLLPVEYPATGTTNIFTARGLTSEFNGSSDWIDCGNVGDFTDNFTLCAWIKTDTAAAKSIIARQNGGNTQYLFGTTALGKIALFDGASTFAGNTIVSDNKYHFVCLVVDGANSQLYVDGQPDGSTFSPSISSFALNLEIGSTLGGTSIHWLGEIHQPIIFSTRKSAAEILALYELGKEVALNGSYAEQLLDETISDPVPIDGVARGDGRISVPMVAIYDPVLEEWIPVWTGSLTSSEQTISALAENGMSGIRLYNKFSEFSSTWFDDIDITNPQIDYAQIPNEQREAFERLVLKYKPLHSWAGALIEYI